MMHPLSSERDALILLAGLAAGCVTP